MPTWNQMSPDERRRFVQAQESFRSALNLARAALPKSADESHATINPVHPDSIGSLAVFESAMRESEFELALYSLAQVASELNVSNECWSAIDEAARLMNIDAARYRR
jgi:hypothetical protein